jgi:hypothetical protein
VTKRKINKRSCFNRRRKKEIFAFVDRHRLKEKQTNKQTAGLSRRKKKRENTLG